MKAKRNAGVCNSCGHALSAEQELERLTDAQFAKLKPDELAAYMYRMMHSSTEPEPTQQEALARIAASRK